MKRTINILVVDDDANLRKTLSDILKVKGCTVITAVNGAAAIAEAQRAAVNVALIDLMLPDMSGIEVMERIKTGSPYTEAIILTGHASLTTAIEATAKGAFSYLLKPYEIENLLLHIRHALDRQQAQEEIRRLASFPSLNPQPVIELAPSGEVSYANPAADKLFPDLRLLGIRHPLLIGLGDIYATFQQGGLTEMVREVAIGESSYEKHLYYVPESELIRITVLDVTERKRAEVLLRDSEARLQTVFESLTEGIAVSDLNGQLLHFNRAALDLHGFATLDECHQHLTKFADTFELSAMDGTVWPVDQWPLARILRGEELRDLAVRIRHIQAGWQRVYSYGGTLVRDAGGQPMMAVVTISDITARKQAEAAVLKFNEELEEKVLARTADLEHARKKAEQANRAKSDFLVNMSHEIRTPMNGVIGMIDVLKQDGLNDRQMEMANIIHDSAFALLAIIDDILDFSRIEAGKLQIGSTSMAIAGVVDGVCETLDSRARKNAVELTRFTDPAIPAQVLGDPGRLRQILLKLVDNAIKFSGGQRRHGRVSVRAMLVESDADRVTLEFRVTDNGIGMDAATQARLFSAFTQADASTTRSFGGAGLGLAISRQLVNIMGGEIKVQSEPGTGSTFTVRLSFALPSAQSDSGPEYIAAGGAKAYDRKILPSDANAAPASLPREEARRQGSLILIAEDNEINQKVFLQQLKLLGRTADIASNGREALELWQGGGYRILLTDLHMPEMDGYELTAAIRASEARAGENRGSETGKPRAPIIAITANALKGEAEHCHAVGMDDYLSKPVQLVNLKAMLEKWLPIAVESVGEINELPAQPVAASIPVDVNVLKALVGDDPAVVREFLHDFRVSAAKTAAELKAVCNSGQAVQAGALAHKLKSSARSVGALALGELCAAMEQAGKAGDTETLAVLLPKFEAEMAAVDEYLDSL